MGIVSLFVVAIVVGLIGYQIYQFAAAKFTPKQQNIPLSSSDMPIKNIPKQNTTQYRCDGRQHCSQMTSCEEAKFFIRNCADTKMDGDGDGIPCEGSLCGY